jgi:hypothetical protein
LGPQKGPHPGHRGSGKTKKVCLVFAVGPESDGNRGSSCYGARDLRARDSPVRVSRGAQEAPRRVPERKKPRKGPGKVKEG